MLTAFHISAMTVSITLAAGMAAGQTDTQNRRDHQSTRTERAQPSGPMAFEKGSDLIGKDVANPNDEVIASIEDVIIDRGSGRLEHVLLKSGAVLGVGGRTVAVPYARLRFDAAKDRFELDMTEEQLERSVEFVPENWAELNNTTWADELDRWWYGDDASVNDEMAVEAVRAGKPETVRGEIVSVDRSGGLRGERVIVGVQTSSGQRESLVLGPSWYVMGHEAAPMRGDTIEAETVRLPAGEEGRRLVVSAKIDGESMQLRDANGQPRWRMMTNRDEQDADRDAKRQQTHGRLMLLSDVIGADASSTDKTGGEVQDVVIERHSGQIAIVAFDPNENLLGIADEIKTVPWGVVRIAPDQKAYIDASNAMLKASTELPDDVSVYLNPGRLEQVFSTFALTPMKFTPRDRDEARIPEDPAWGKKGFYTTAFRDAPDATVRGRVTDVRSESLRDGTPDARIVAIETSEGERLVILGPEWFMKRQSISVKDGDEVVIHGKQARIGTRDYVCAHSISSGGRDLTLWESDAPVWTDRGGR